MEVTCIKIQSRQLRQGKVYVLAESEGEMGLVTINVTER